MGILLHSRLARAVALAAALGLLFSAGRHLAGPGGPSAPSPALQAEASGDIARPRAERDAQIWTARLLAARAREPGPDRRIEIGFAFGQWLAADFDQALAYARGLPAGPDRDQALFAALDFARQRDASRALALALSLGDVPALLPFYSAVFDQLAAGPRPEAAAELARLPPGLARLNAVRALAVRWAEADPTTTLTWANTLAPGPERDAALDTTLSLLAQNDPLQAAQLALKTLSGPALDRVLGSALGTLIDQDLSAATALIALLPAGATQTGSAAEAARALAQVDPRAALDWSRRLPDLAAAHAAAGAAMAAWADVDPAGLAAYAAALPTAPGDIATQAAAILGKTSPADGIALIRALPDPQARQLAEAALVMGWTAQDPAAAAGWAAGLSGPEAPAVLSGALGIWLPANPSAVQQFVGQLPASEQPAAAAGIAGPLAATDAVAAIDWAQSLSTDPARHDALVAIAQTWASSTPLAATTWAEGLPDGATREAVLSAIAAVAAKRGSAAIN